MNPIEGIGLENMYKFSMAETCYTRCQKTKSFHHPDLLYIAYEIITWFLGYFKLLHSFKLFTNISWFMFVNSSCL